MANSTSRPYSPTAYRDLIGGLAASGVRFASFLDPPRADGRTLYLRHDVDFSLALALELAEINNDLGVSGTFFVQLRAQLYNPFEQLEADRVRRILALGQHVGLHYVGDYEGQARRELVDSVLGDFDLFRRLFPDALPVVSWHKPIPAILAAEDVDLPGLVSAYGARFFRQAQYVSDSTHRRSVDDIERELAESHAPEVQLLLHPLNWIAGGSSGVEIMIRGWIRVLGDQERALQENRTYAARFPDGLPPHLLRRLESDLLAAAGPTASQ